MIKIDQDWIADNCTVSLAETSICELIKWFKLDGLQIMRDFYRTLDDPTWTPEKERYRDMIADGWAYEGANQLMKDRASLYPSLKAEGQKRPIFIWQTDKKQALIADGGNRLVVMEALGYKTIKTLDLGIELRYCLKHAFPTGKGTEKIIYQPLEFGELDGFDDYKIVRPDNYTRADAMLKEIDDEDKTFVDIGCNIGFMSRYFLKKLGWRLFTNVDISEPCALAAYLLFMMHTFSNPLFGPEELRNCLVGDYRDLTDVFDVSLNLSVFHHFFKVETRKQLEERFKHLSSITRRKMFIEIYPYETIVKSGDEEVKQIFRDGIENFLLETTGASSIKVLGDFWGGRRLYLLKKF